MPGDTIAHLVRACVLDLGLCCYSVGPCGSPSPAHPQPPGRLVEVQVPTLQVGLGLRLCILVKQLLQVPGRALSPRTQPRPPATASPRCLQEADSACPTREVSFPPLFPKPTYCRFPVSVSTQRRAQPVRHAPSAPTPLPLSTSSPSPPAQATVLHLMFLSQVDSKATCPSLHTPPHSWEGLCPAL